MKKNKLLTLLVVIAATFVSVSCMPLSEHIDYNAEWIMVIESLSNPEERITIKNSDTSFWIFPLGLSSIFIFIHHSYNERKIALVYANVYI